MKRAVMGIVQDKNQAEYVVGQLHYAGFSNSDISVLLPEPQATRAIARDHGTKAPQAALAGGLVGGTLGLLAGIGALAIPGLGAFIAAGPLLGTLSGAAAGATFGGVAGVLVGLGVPEIEAKRYERRLRSGDILVAIQTDTRQKQEVAERIYKTSRADDVFSTAEIIPATLRGWRA